jgi:hypothetical protein
MNESGSSRWSAVSILAVALALSACGGQGRTGHAPPDEASAYLQPPTLWAAERAVDDAVRLSGRAPANALVRLRSPDGGGAMTRAGSNGLWSVILPAAASPRLYSIQAELPNREVRGEGAIAVMPPPGPLALTLRAGFAGVPAGQGQRGRLELTNVDYDGGGAAGGGFAPPLSRVRLTLDGGVVGLTNADAQGRFAVLATERNITPGPHRIRVDTPEGLSLEEPVELNLMNLPPDQPFAAARAPGGWLIGWRIPGGGVQSSLVFDQASSSGTPGSGAASGAPAPRGAAR